MRSLAGKVALVTGGAGGIGTAICEALAGSGASVVVGYHRSCAPAEQLAGRLPGAFSVPHAALHALVTDSAALDQAWRDDQAARTPLKRLAMPEEVAQAVVVIAAGLTFTTGAIIPVDGGRPLG